MGVIGIILGATNPAARVPAPTSLPASGGVAVAFFYIWTAFYSMGWNGTPWVVNSESFPGSIRQVCSTFAAASNWLWNFVISRATPYMFRQMGHSGYGVVSTFTFFPSATDLLELWQYIFFALMQVASVFYVIFLLPETKGIVSLQLVDSLRPSTDLSIYSPSNQWTCSSRHTKAIHALHTEKSSSTFATKSPPVARRPNTSRPPASSRDSRLLLTMKRKSKL